MDSLSLSVQVVRSLDPRTVHLSCTSDGALSFGHTNDDRHLAVMPVGFNRKVAENQSQSLLTHSRSADTHK